MKFLSAESLLCMWDAGSGLGVPRAYFINGPTNKPGSLRG
jgi:hypothetical protein